MKVPISKSDIKQLNDKLQSLYSVTDLISKKDTVEIMDKKYVLVNKIPYLFYHEDKPVPTLKLLLKNNFMKKVTVDMGAIKFVIKGADIMRPGIVEFDEVNEGDLVSVIDATNKKPLCVGIMQVSSEHMNTNPGGKAIKNIHYIGDEIWKIDG